MKVKKIFIKGNMALFTGLLLFINMSTIFGQTGGDYVYSKKTTITGVFAGSLEPKIKLEVNQKFINNSLEKLETEMVNDSFRFDFDLSVPQTVTIKYLRNSADVYIEPGQTLHIDADASSFYFSFEFKGESAGNNNFLRSFCQKYKTHYPKSVQMFRYKKGIVWYKVHRDMDTHMRGKEPEAFTAFMLADKTEKMGMLEGHEMGGKSTLTEDFKLYMWSEIDYYWAYHMLTYGYSFGFFHSIDFQDFFGFMYEVPMQSDRTLGSKYYREFLIGAVNYYCEGPKKLPDPIKDVYHDQLMKQYEYGAENLEGRPRAFYMAETIHRGYQANLIQEMMKVGREFKKDNPYKEFNKRLLDDLFLKQN